MTPEEKVKAYDEAYKRAAIRFGSNVADELFPELKESVDEKIRKELITHCRNIRCVTEEGAESIAKWIAWLEKQGEQKSTLPKWKYKKDNTPLLRDSLILNKYMCVAKSPSGAIVSDVWVIDYNELAKLPKEELEKQSEQETLCDKCKKEQPSHSCQDMTVLGRCAIEHEQKPTDKVEPKFHEGQWITNGDYTWKIVEVKPLDYILQSQDGNIVDDTISYVDEQFYLWTIKDAKSGDVLACNEEILLFKSYSVQGRISLYCWYNGQTNNFHSEEVVETLLTTRNKICPATKEQREFLFQKMKEDGWEWNAEKKELKKIIAPKFNVRDCIIKKHNCDINDFGYFIVTDITDGKYWYNNIIICDISEQDEWELYEPVRQKTTDWSEEDEHKVKDIIYFLDTAKKHYASTTVLDACIDWLKSLKRPYKSETKETLLPDEFLVRCYEDNKSCYRKGEVYVAKLVERPNRYSNELLRVWHQGSKVCNGRREGNYIDFFVSPLQKGNIYAIGNFERIS